MANQNLTSLKNLKPINLSHEEAVNNGKKGGRKSVEARKEKKLLSQLYAEVLTKANDLDGKGLSLTDVIIKILLQCNSTSVTMLKEIREATEPNKLNIFEDFNIDINPAPGLIKRNQITVNFVATDPSQIIDDTKNQTNP